MSNINRVGVVFVGSGANTGTGVLPMVNVGDLNIYDGKNNLIDTVAKAQALSANDQISIATAGGKNKNVIMSRFTGSGVSKYEGKSYVAPVQKTILIGDPANGGINISSGYEYRLRVLIDDDVRVHGQRKTLHDSNFPASNVTTQESVASFIACIYNQDEYGHSMIKELVKLERVSDGTFAALANDATVTNGSKLVTSTAHTLTVGSKVYLRIGGTGANTPVYVATVLDANTFELDTEYVGESEIVLAANILSSTDASNWGFLLTAIPQESLLERAANEPVYDYEWIKFDAVFSKADERELESITPKIVIAKLNPGQGHWEQVANREEHAKGYWGDTAKGDYTYKRINNVVDPTKTYNSIVITNREVSNGAFQDTYSSPMQLEIYIPVGTDQGDDTPVNEKFLAILNAYMVDVLKFEAIIF
jgi:hypothetical protein